MIGQNEGLPYLIPLAMEILAANPFVEGDFFPGDLLQNVLEIRSGFWKEYPAFHQQLSQIVHEHREAIRAKGIRTGEF